MTNDRKPTVLGWIRPGPDTEDMPAVPLMPYLQDAPPGYPGEQPYASHADHAMYTAGQHPRPPESPGAYPIAPPRRVPSSSHAPPNRPSPSPAQYAPPQRPSPAPSSYAPQRPPASAPYATGPSQRPSPSSYPPPSPSPYATGPSQRPSPSSYPSSAFAPYATAHYGSPYVPLPYLQHHAQQPREAPPYGAPPYPHAVIPPPAPRTSPPRTAGGPHRSIGRADATTGVSDRVRFIRLTYLHLLAAILGFSGLLWVLMTQEPLVSKLSIPLARFATGGRANWAIVLAAFMAISWAADYWASHASSRGVQYVGLVFYVIAEALIFVPLLTLVEWKTHAILARGGVEPHIVRDAGFVTLGIFATLTLSVFLSRKDFSFLRSGLAMVSGAALSLIAMSLLFGFNLGLAFSVGMVLLAAGYVLFQTSQVLAHYDPRQHVGAALALFSSVALMFWYVIRILLRARS